MNKWTKENLEEIILNSSSSKDVFKKLGIRPAGGNWKTLRKYINLYQINTNHFYENGNRGIKIKLEKILIKNSSYNRTSLKKRLYDANLLKPICCLCGQDENWNGVKISLILDHINGIYNDNRLENLRIVCPNCNAGLETFAGKNRKNFKKKKEYKCKCGVNIRKESELCIKCKGIKKRKVNRPPLEILLLEVKENGYSATGRKYGVSDNAVRKWLK